MGRHDFVHVYCTPVMMPTFFCNPLTSLLGSTMRYTFLVLMRFHDNYWMDHQTSGIDIHGLQRWNLNDFGYLLAFHLMTSSIVMINQSKPSVIFVLFYYNCSCPQLQETILFQWLSEHPTRNKMSRTALRLREF